jgi:hypothetical protein
MIEKFGTARMDVLDWCQAPASDSNRSNKRLDELSLCVLRILCDYFNLNHGGHRGRGENYLQSFALRPRQRARPGAKANGLAPRLIPLRLSELTVAAILLRP